jgi:hypothetical protein
MAYIDNKAGFGYSSPTGYGIPGIKGTGTSVIDTKPVTTESKWNLFGSDEPVVNIGDWYKNQFGTDLDLTKLSTTEQLALQNQFKKDTTTDWGMGGYGGMALGVGQLGLGVMSYLDQKKTADKNRALMDQQLASNRELLETRRNRAKDISAAFGGGKV